MITTLEKIRSHYPCRDGWGKLLRRLGKTQADDEPLAVTTILDSNGFDDALWCLRAVGGYDREIRLYAVWCARRVQHLMRDPRSVAALDVAERYARGRASDAELIAARAAAEAAAEAAEAAAEAAEAAAAAAASRATREVPWNAARGASVAAEAAEVAAAAAASRATREVPWNAARGASVAAEVAEVAAAAAAAHDAQAAELRRVCLEIEAGRDPYPEEAGR